MINSISSFVRRRGGSLYFCSLYCALVLVRNLKISHYYNVELENVDVVIAF